MYEGGYKKFTSSVIRNAEFVDISNHVSTYDGERYSVRPRVIPSNCLRVSTL